MSAIRAIYGGCRQLGIDEEDRRDLFERVTGKRSVRAMTPKEQESVVLELRSKGFKPASNAKRKLTGPYAKKLQALWIGAWNLGLIRSRNDDALIAFVKRQTGIDHTRFLHYPEDAEKVIEALKAWMARDGGVDWSQSRIDPPWRSKNGARIASAQWNRLTEDQRKEHGSFWRFIAGHVDPANRQNPTVAEWISVMNALGKQIRAGQKR